MQTPPAAGDAVFQTFDAMAFASVTIEDMFAVNNIRVVNSEKGLFVAMPQTKPFWKLILSMSAPLHLRVVPCDRRRAAARVRQ